MSQLIVLFTQLFHLNAWKFEMICHIVQQLKKYV